MGVSHTGCVNSPCLMGAAWGLILCQALLGLGFFIESHLKNVCLLIPAVSRSWAISLLSISVPPCYSSPALRMYLQPL